MRTNAIVLSLTPNGSNFPKYLFIVPFLSEPTRLTHIPIIWFIYMFKSFKLKFEHV